MIDLDNVLSLFDGISSAQLALNKLGFVYKNYYASEIDKQAIKVTQSHFPNTIQLGNVINIKCSDLPKIDLLLGGSPCQGYSFSGKMLNFNDSRSKLFFEFVRILNETKPKYWLFENVVMKKEYEQIISSYLNVEPVLINSSLVSAQNRERLYWSNINITQPTDKNINLIDILDNSDLINPASIRGRKLNEFGIRDDSNKNIPYSQCLEVKATNLNKSNCLTTVEKDNVLTNLPTGRYKDAFTDNIKFRYYTLKEYCKLQTLPEYYFDNIVSESLAKKMIGNGWTIDVITHILANLK